MIEIKENGEKLIDISKLCPDLVINLNPPRAAYLRETVAKMVQKAKSYLPSGVTFVIGDAWRSQDIQKEIYQGFYRKYHKAHPNWSKAEITKQVENFVAPYEGENVSGHMTGAAVDLRLIKKGRKIPMKSTSLTYEENALSDQPKLPKFLQRNRQIMFSALKKAGLSNFPKEYWHWSYGDFWWAKRNNKNVAIYGPKKL